MKRSKGSIHPHAGGSALIVSLVFIVVFSALATALATMSGTNVQMAENHRRLQTTRACAESGLEVIRYWMSKVSISGTTEPDARFAQVATALQNELNAAGVTNVATTYSGTTITISDVPLSASRGESFSAALTAIDCNSIQLDVTGHYKSLDRTIRSHYVFGTRANTVFDFGVASKGPVSLQGNIELEGVNLTVESNAYIESLNDLLALTIQGNSHIAGTVKIVNGLACVDLQGGHAGIGGATGEEAIQLPYVTYDVPATEFPEMVPEHFETYVNTVLDPNTDTSADATFENIRIPADLNPTFSGHATLKGVIYIESPNVVVFTATTDVTGIIVGDGDQTDDSGTNQIVFQGNVNSWPVSDLPAESQYEGLHEQIGTFIIAPGFAVSFGGSFDALCGAIAANGIEFFGNAGGTINGSIINYADTEMSLSGNSDLYFNRSGLDDLPAGFVPELVLMYDASSYGEII
ncbi:MAG: pilus assembly PilX N-terminal domain-containing protein [Sedimentisphaerales bacterium]|nr:pilus assembly PilX N-terminal domain-containing protein [Sedimentisphaerales bacterium]